MSNVWLLLGVTSLSFVLTSIVEKYALKRRLIDIPNERSSHVEITPRGGGTAIVTSFMLALMFLFFRQRIDSTIFLAFGGGALVAALIGLMDDLRDIRVSWRLCAHFFAVSWVMYWLGGVSGPVEPAPSSVAWLATIVGAVVMVWIVNLYNFMDGIDGIASIEAITVCGIGSALYLTIDADSHAWIIPAVVAASVAGFLYWNFPPARIFMGDTGSVFLGCILAALCLEALHLGAQYFGAWAILLGVFVVDASVTLLRRVLRGHKFYAAHRSHAYQYASRVCGAHAPVVVAVGLINIICLAPVAFLVAAEKLSWVAGLLITYIPLIGLAILFKAGASEQQQGSTR